MKIKDLEDLEGKLIHCVIRSVAADILGTQADVRMEIIEEQEIIILQIKEEVNG